MYTGKVKIMLRLIFPIFAAISLQASFHVNAADNMLPAEEFHTSLSQKIFKREGARRCS